jgi:hypothetical protein
MITALTSTSKHLNVSGGGPTSIWINDGAPSAGLVRYRNNNFEVYDGASWVTVNGSLGSIGIVPSSEAALDWAMKKMIEEANLKTLADTHPAVKIAVENLEKAKLQLDATIILSTEHDKSTS